ncbi:hypothetical protein [Amycolatopsis thermophila]|uniref:Uncharacterized protein n=1 Tax=Amycolatopsis thermophila TaxID=206084 RepID=A0ABU0EUT7_9PSEU|nr:hypothetical protein [Amycolatopsis thermophila]MDQ0379047.1 hypothetical protein [Amycolatopsis thermophila]
MNAQLAEFADDEVRNNDYLTWVKDRGFSDIYDVQQSVFPAGMNVRLICPPSIAEAVVKLVGQIHSAQETALSGHAQTANDFASNAELLWSEAFALMAADLDQSSSRVDPRPAWANDLFRPKRALGGQPGA